MNCNERFNLHEVVVQDELHRRCTSDDKGKKLNSNRIAFIEIRRNIITKLTLSLFYLEIKLQALAASLIYQVAISAQKTVEATVYSITKLPHKQVSNNK